MKFSTKKYPILNHLDDWMSLFKFQEHGFTEKLFSAPDMEDRMKHLMEIISLVVEHGTIDYVSASFLDKVLDSKIYEKLLHLFCKIDTCEGILLYPPERASSTHAISYVVIPDPDNNTALAEIHLYSQVGRVATLEVKIEDEIINWRAILSNVIVDKNGKQLNQAKKNEHFGNHINCLFAILTFKQFAEIEVKEIGGNKYPKRTKIGNEKYLNQTDHQVNVLDSRWFTETIRSEGFAVSGHFRLQPYGPNMSKRKLIYIDDYLKSGYTRKARIEAEQNN